jgi:hypothetical protein
VPGNNELSVVFSLSRQLYCLRQHTLRNPKSRPYAITGTSSGSLPLEASGSFATAPCYLAAIRCPGMQKKKFFGLSECPELTRLMKDLRREGAL